MPERPEPFGRAVGGRALLRWKCWPSPFISDLLNAQLVSPLRPPCRPITVLSANSGRDRRMPPYSNRRWLARPHARQPRVKARVEHCHIDGRGGFSLCHSRCPSLVPIVSWLDSTLRV